MPYCLQLRAVVLAHVGSILRRRSCRKLHLTSSNKIGKVERTTRVTVLRRWVQTLLRTFPWRGSRLGSWAHVFSGMFPVGSSAAWLPFLCRRHLTGLGKRTGSRLGSGAQAFSGMFPVGGSAAWVQILCGSLFCRRLTCLRNRTSHRVVQSAGRGAARTCNRFAAPGTGTMWWQGQRRHSLLIVEWSAQVRQARGGPWTRDRTDTSEIRTRWW